MLIVDGDTILYRIGFSNPPDANSAVNQVVNYTRGLLVNASNAANVNYTGPVKTGAFTHDNHHIYLGMDTGSRFRDQFSKHIRYKATRTAKKPLFMSEMANALRTNFDVTIVPSNLYEADDVVSRHAHSRRDVGEPYVVCGIDKDLLQIPGHHYNYVTNNFYHISETEADKYFFKQLLMGDVSDNIPGIRGLGPKRAAKYLAKGSNPLEWWGICVEKYAEAYPNISDDDLTQMLYERGNMLWIRRYDEELWSPPIPTYSPF